MSKLSRVAVVASWQAIVVISMLVAVACGGGGGGGSDGLERAAATRAKTEEAGGSRPTLRIGSIPDQDPAKLVERDSLMAEILSDKLGVEVEYVPVSDYAASVTLFRTGDLDLVFYGGLTGVQARLQTSGSRLIAQRDIDEQFESVFIGHVPSDLEPVDDISGLAQFKNTRFTFGSETSTSGRLMPQFFLDQAGVGPDDFKGEPGFSGSHDKTVDLVEAGTFDGGALNAQVWDSRVDEGTVATDRVQLIFRTPAYQDYHWLAAAAIDEVFGKGFTDKIQDVILGLDPGDPDEGHLLDLYGAGAFVPTRGENYDEVETIGRKLGLIR